MRNLKKVLALALAVVMLVGMMVVGAGAASYKDTASSDYSDAIEVVTAIEALKGNGGNFNPDGRLTRADATVMLARVVLGAENVGKLVGATGIYTDVSAKHYAAGAIAWATNEGIISGEGNGTFRPNGSLYGVHFAKMLLGAMGFRADVEGFNGTDYQNIILTAALVGLLEGLEDVELNGRITRAQAAQMAFNAIQLDTRASYSSELTAVNGQLTSTFVREMKNDQTLFDKYGVAKVTVPPTVNNIGYTYWVANEEPVLTTVGAPDAGITITGLKTAAALGNGVLKDVEFAALDADEDGTDDTFINPIINGADDVAEIKTAADVAALTGNGKTVKLYTAKNTENVTVVYAIEVSYESLLEVDSISFVKSTGVYTFAFNALTGDSVTSVTFIDDEEADNTLYNQLVAMELEEGDLLVATTDDGAIDTVAEPTTVTGLITETDTTKKTMTVGGVAYTENFDMAGTVTFANNYLVLGSDNTVLAVEAVTPDTPDAVEGYIYVTESWTEASGREAGKSYFAGYTLDGTYVEEIEASAELTLDAVDYENNLYHYEINADGQYVFDQTGMSYDTVMEIANGKIDGTFAAGTVTYTYLYLNADDELVVVVDTEIAEIETDEYFVIAGLDGTTPVVTNIVVFGEKFVEPEYDYEDGIVYVGATLDTTAAANKKLAANSTEELAVYSYNCEVYIDGVKTALWMDGASYAQGFYKYYVNAETGAYKLQAIAGTSVITLKTVVVDASAPNVEFYKDWYITDSSDNVYVATDAELYCLTANTAINNLKDAVEFDAEGTVTLNFYGYTASGVKYVTAIYVTYAAD